MHEHNLVLRGGTIVDGTGIPRYRADLAVKDGRIAMISGRIPAGAAREIDAGILYGGALLYDFTEEGLQRANAAVVNFKDTGVNAAG